MVPACGWIPRTSAAWPAGRRHAALAGPARRAAGGAGASRPAAVRRPARRHDAGRMAGGASRRPADAARSPGSWRPTWCWPTGWRKPGAFGESDERPLRSATLQRLVPALFQLSTGPDAAACAVGGAWAGRYRLDALRPQAPATVNRRICCWGTAARWPGCRRCCSRPCRRPGKRQAATRRRWTMRPGRRDAGWMPGSRRCSTRMVVFPYSLSRNSGGPRAAGKMGWPRRRGLADGRGPRPQPYRAGRRRNRISPFLY